MNDEAKVEVVVVGKPFGLPTGLAAVGDTIMVSKNTARTFPNRLVPKKVAEANKVAADAIAEAAADTEDDDTAQETPAEKAAREAEDRRVAAAQQ